MSRYAPRDGDRVEATEAPRRATAAPRPFASLTTGGAKGFVRIPSDADAARIMLALIDNYDSFSYNLVHFLGELGAEATVWRNDTITPEDVLAQRPEAIVLSPGPCDPDKAGICLELARRAAGRAPLLGVCLGHQAIAQAFGARIVRAPTPMHGKLSDIRHRGGPLFAGLPSPFEATRYHSLTVEPESLPDAFEVTADAADGTIMAISHRELPLHGVQFHPESIASEYGHEVLANFLDIAGVRRRRAAA